MAGTTVTTLAKKKMVKARAGISSLPKIVGMAFGDGGVDSGGTVKSHSADQNTLHHELLRKNVDGYEVLSDTKIRYRCTLAENELANTYISEVFTFHNVSINTRAPHSPIIHRLFYHFLSTLSFTIILYTK